SLPKHVELSVLLDDIKNVHHSIKALIDNFRFYRMENEFSQEKMLEKMLNIAEKENLLTDSKVVLHSLKEREKKGGLGIPDTNLALFHARNKHIKTLIFQIAH